MALAHYFGGFVAEVGLEHYVGKFVEKSALVHHFGKFFMELAIGKFSILVNFVAEVTLAHNSLTHRVSAA